MSRILWLAPAVWRRRYGPEVIDLLASSKRPLADRVDLIRTCLGLRGATVREAVTMRTCVLVTSLMALGLGIAWAAAADQQLANGLVELPGHWWSAPALGLVVAGAAGVAWLAWPRRLA